MCRFYCNISYKVYMISFSREYMPLRLGANEYSGSQIDAAQVVTIGKGLCYKLEFLEKSVPTNVDESFTFIMASSLQVEKLSFDDCIK